MNKNKLFKEYYIGRRGLYHNKNVVILSVYHDVVEYQDFGIDFDNLVIEFYYEDGSKKVEKLKGNLILSNLNLYKDKN